MSEGFPVFVGITGKREFSGNPQTAHELEHKARDRIAAVVDHIDQSQPEITKILLTGAAIGADLIAAEEVLGIADGSRPGKARRNWLVVAVLPFDAGLFKEDFTDDEWKRFERVTGDARTRTWVMPPLRDAAGTPVASADLDRRQDATEAQKEWRRRHYEQVGLWIVDTANILLGVMSAAERADKVGGTARIIACRRSGRPDPIATQVIAASDALAPRNELHRPPSGYAWLIDPAAEPLCAQPPVTVLPPAPDNTPWRVVYENPCGLGAAEDAGVQEPGEKPPSQSEHLHESQRLLRIAGDYVRAGKSDAKADAPLSAWPRGDDAATALRTIWHTLRDATNGAGDRYRRVVYALIGAFLLTVLSWESFAEFTPTKPYMLTTYLVMLVITMIGYVFAARLELQPIAEDRRAIHETLRIQAAWWNAGLADRVDHVYLEGADHDLARVREAARNVVAYALLICEMRLSPASWENVFDPAHWAPFSPRMASRNYPHDWVGSQLFYFRQRKDQRRAKGEFNESLSWSLFATGVFLAVALLVGIALHFGEEIVQFVHSAFPLSQGREELVALLAVAGASVCWWLGSTLMPEATKNHERMPLTIVTAVPAAVLLFAGAHAMTPAVVHIAEPPFIGLAIFMTPAILYAIHWWRTVLPDANHVHRVATVFGLGAALFAATGVMALITAIVVHEPEHELIAHFGHALQVFLVIFVPALAGSLRFISEKFAVEAEAIAYRDGHVWFEHAREMLSELKPGQGNEDADRRARDIVRRLGELALGESETWLKTRRQRPLSPVIGG
jgi:hypothetical protein